MKNLRIFVFIALNFVLFALQTQAQIDHLSFEVQIESPTGNFNIVHVPTSKVLLTNNLNIEFTGTITIQFQEPFEFFFDSFDSPSANFISSTSTATSVSVSLAGLAANDFCEVILKPASLCAILQSSPFPDEDIETNVFTFVAQDQGGSPITAIPEAQVFPLETTELFVTNFSDHDGEPLASSSVVQHLFMGFNSWEDEGLEDDGFVRSYDIGVTGYSRYFEFNQTPEMEITMNAMRFVWMRPDDGDWEDPEIIVSQQDFVDNGDGGTLFRFGEHPLETTLDFGLDPADNFFLNGDIIRVSENFSVTACTVVQPGQFPIPSTEFKLTWYCNAITNYHSIKNRAVKVTPASSEIGITMASDILGTEGHLLHLCDDDATVIYTFSNPAPAVPNTGHKQIHSVQIPVNLSWFGASSPGDLDIALVYDGVDVIPLPADVTYNSSQYLLTIIIPDNFLEADSWYGTNHERMLPEGASFSVELRNLEFYCNDGNLLGWAFDGASHFFSDEGQFSSCLKATQMPFDHQISNNGGVRYIRVHFNNMCTLSSEGYSNSTTSAFSLFSNNNTAMITSNGATNVYASSLDEEDPFYDENASTPEITVSFGGNGQNPFLFTNGSIPLFDTAQVSYQVRVLLPEFLAPQNSSDEFEISFAVFDEMINNPNNPPPPVGTSPVIGQLLVENTGELNGISFNYVEFLVEVPSYSGAIQFNLGFDFAHAVCAEDPNTLGGLVNMYFQTEAISGDCEDCVYVTACAKRDILVHCIGPCSSLVGTHENSLRLKRTTLGWTDEDMTSFVNAEDPDLRLDRVYPGDLVELSVLGSAGSVDELFFEIFYIGTAPLFTFLDGGTITYTDVNETDTEVVPLTSNPLQIVQDGEEVKISLSLGDVPTNLTPPLKLNLEAYLVADISPGYNPNGTLSKFIDQAVFGQFYGLVGDSTFHYSCDPWGDEMTFIKAAVYHTRMGSQTIGFKESGKNISNPIADNFAFHQNAFFVRGLCSRQMIFGSGVFGTMISSDGFMDFPNEFRPVVHWKEHPNLTLPDGLEFEMIQDDKLYHHSVSFDAESKVWRQGTIWESVSIDETIGNFAYEGVNGVWTPLAQDGSAIHNINPAHNYYDLSIARQVRSVFKYAGCPEFDIINPQIVNDGEVGNYGCVSESPVEFDFPYFQSPWLPDNQNPNSILLEYDNCKEKIYYNMGITNPGGNIELSQPEGTLETLGLQFFVPSGVIPDPALYIERAFLRFDEDLITVEGISVLLSNNNTFTLLPDDMVDGAWPLGRVIRISNWDQISISIAIDYSWVKCHEEIPVTFGFTCDGAECDGCSQGSWHHLPSGFEPCWEDEIIIQPEIFQGTPNFTFAYNGDENTSPIGGDACDTYPYVATISNDGMASIWDPVFTITLDENLIFDGGLTEASLISSNGQAFLIYITDFEIICEDGVCTYTLNLSDFIGSTNEPFELLPEAAYHLHFGVTANCTVSLYDPLTVTAGAQVSNFCGDPMVVLNSGNNIPIIPFTNDICTECPPARQCLQILNELGDDYGVSLSLLSEDDGYIMAGIMNRNISDNDYYFIEFDADGYTNSGQDGYLIDWVDREEIVKNSLVRENLLYMIGDAVTDQSSPNKAPLLTCFVRQPDGSYIQSWSRVYKSAGSTFTSGILYDEINERLLLTGSFENTSAGFILAVASNSGNLVAHNQFNIPINHRIRLTDATFDMNGDVLISGIEWRTTQNSGFLIILKANPLNLQLYQNAGTNTVYSAFNNYGTSSLTSRLSTCNVNVLENRIFLTGANFRNGNHTYIIELTDIDHVFWPVDNAVIRVQGNLNQDLLSRNAIISSSGDLYIVGESQWSGWVMRLSLDQSIEPTWLQGVNLANQSKLFDVAELKTGGFVATGAYSNWINPENNFWNILMTSFDEDGESCCLVPGPPDKTKMISHSMPTSKKVSVDWFIMTGGAVSNYLETDVFCDAEDIVHKSFAEDIFSETETPSTDIGMKVFPNPTSGNYRIELINQEDVIESLIIQDVYGRIVDQGSFGSNSSASVFQSIKSDVVNGIYYIQVKTTEGHRFTSRLVISK